LHGIHPMHVESVAWISERKDLMYSLFYFIGLMMYVHYTQGTKLKWMLYLNIFLALVCLWGIVELKDFSLDFTAKGHDYSIGDPIIIGFFLILLLGAIGAELKYPKFKIELFYVWEFFLISLFSKPMAVSFPLSILVVDILLKRDKDMIPNKGIFKILASIFSFTGKKVVNFIVVASKLCLEKWMFFVVAVLSGLQSVFLEIGHNTVVFTHGYTVIQKLLISSYAFMMYTVDAFFPANLCGYYPYPGLTSDHFLPTIYYLAPWVSIVMVSVPLYLARKDKNLLRAILFGIGFYFVNLVFILQFLSAGTTVMSDRYSYVSYFGLIFIVVYLAHWLWSKNKSYHVAIKGFLAVSCIVLAYMCYGRTKVWHNPETFWSDVIAKSNRQSQLPYLNLGNYYVDSGKFDKAYMEYITLAKLNTDQAEVYRNLAMILGQRKQFDSSIYYFAKAVNIDTTSYDIYLNRAITYSMMGKLDLAIKDYNKAYTLDSTSNDVLSKRAYALSQTGRYEDAVRDYNKLISREPKEPSNYLYRGNVLLNGGNPQAAIQDYLHLLELQPTNGECMYDLSLAYDRLSDEKDALSYALRANQNKYQVPVAYLNKLQKSGSR
jgi:protein O-mannosyl-transferase